MNKEIISFAIQSLATLVLLSQIFLVILGAFYLYSRVVKKNKVVKSVVKFFSDNALSFAFLVALVATAGSLFLSDFAHFTPCKLCWYQRIAMYPQIILLGIAAVKNDISVKRYVLPIVGVGAIISFYHYLLQMSPIPLPCTDEVANCALKQVAPYGYITIPLMALTGFVLIAVFVLLAARTSRK